MSYSSRLYIDGQWVRPNAQRERELVNPPSEDLLGAVSLGSAAETAETSVALTGMRGEFARRMRASLRNDGQRLR